MKDRVNMQQRFSGNLEHSVYVARIEILEMLQARGLEISPDVSGYNYDKPQ
jgi:hypothetical protein